MKRLLVISLVAGLFSGCGGNTTGIVKINDDTYMLGAQDYWETSGSQVKAKLYAEASAFCAKSGKQVQQVTDSSVDHAVARTSAGAEIQFRCK